MSLVTLLANLGLLLCCRRDAQRLEQALAQPEAAQQQLLLALLAQNRDTAYGRAHHFGGIRSVEDYRRLVPVTGYEDYAAAIERIGGGEQGVLTREPVLLFEITSGSTSASKLIPYTATLKTEFSAGIKPWLHNLYTACPALCRGKSYWSITPATHRQTHTSGGIPIGFEEDTAYLGRVEQLLLNQIFVRPEGIHPGQSMEEFYFVTARALLDTPSLALVSVWNPSYLLLLLDYIDRERERLLAALPRRRAAVVAPLLASRDYTRVWPRLAVISCWGDGAAAPGFRQLQALCPGVFVQPKGLLATEAFMTLPLWGQTGGLLSLCSHFFEFQAVDTGDFVPYSQLREGALYEILLTTGGGFYRYRIKDVVRVCGFHPVHKLPLLQFAGKADKVSDRHGEKLNELFVKEALARLEPDFALQGRFCLLAYARTGYCLYLERGADPGEGPRLAQALDDQLRQNFHYDYCRRLGQLTPLAVRYIGGDPAGDHLRACVQRGRKLGDVKAEVLSTETGWEEFFQLEDCS